MGWEEGERDLAFGDAWKDWGFIVIALNRP